ncbi:ClpXP protease specificity-enhancing factor [Wenzhouxiangella sp. XN79A]|uniref:ClpXP protease specificity-enhancing factor n=1 Tax=Wenzhouxiangella sp. XN79A TaxID=2724193 RepID=UPI00144AE9D4|nr:ClpXP protease specificity-enhancing factor [Wenzhouxiangella sp. XN79A]NKI34217.1 ClpXP protease specificity-enhancing factor [Wenzhouxiangella sp. XN79A]
MSSSRPYLLRALYEWIVDNGATPQILVDGTDAELQIPESVRSGDKVVLNISPSAVRDFDVDADYVSFVARFSGVSHGVVVPIDAVLAIYARENGQGMMFPDAEDGDAEPAESPGPRPVEGPPASERPDGSGEDPDDDPDGPDGGRKRRPNLKIIK